jgi:hypothetical protein
MNELRRVFFEEGRRLDADPSTRDQSVCWICLGRIDYDAEPGSTPDSHNLDHYHTVSQSPEMQEDPANFRHSHRRCNGARGALAPEADLGELVADWW